MKIQEMIALQILVVPKFCVCFTPVILPLLCNISQFCIVWIQFLR